MSTIITLRYLKIWAGLSKSGTSITSSKMVNYKQNQMFFRLYSCRAIGPHWRILASRCYWCPDESNAGFAFISWRYSS
jgi:hypothetical protein